MDNANEFPVKKMCQVFNVSRSGYYKWFKNRDSCSMKETELNKEIKAAFKKSRQTYGSPRIVLALKKKGTQLDMKKEE